MTTNNPEVVAWSDPGGSNVFADWVKNQLTAMGGDDGLIAETCDTALIRLSDYEALQAELKKAVAALTGGGFTRCDGPAGWRPPLGNPAGTLIDRIDSLQSECEKLRKGLAAVQDLVTNSEGVAGLHLNGDVAPWDDLREAGRFEEWLIDFDAATQHPDNKPEVAPSIFREN